MRARYAMDSAAARARELSRGQAGIDLLCRRRGQCGWRVAAVAGTLTEQGLSAGVAIAVSSSCRMTCVGYRLLGKWDASPTLSPSRLVMAWVDTIPPGGLVMLSVSLDIRGANHP